MVPPGTVPVPASPAPARAPESFSRLEKFTTRSSMLMYTASLSYNKPPTSDIGAYRSFERSSSLRCFLSALGSGHGSGRALRLSTAMSPTPATCTSWFRFRLHPCSQP